MSAQDVSYTWEEFPEYRATQQLSRCIGRILMSLPPRARKAIGRTLIRTPMLIAQSIAGASADMPPGEGLTIDERETFRTNGLAGIHLLRDTLRALRAERLGSVPDLMAALELVDRIEEWVSQRVLPGQLP
jgi:hypothetical protein